MATAKKKAPAKKATNRRITAKTAPATKRIVRRRKPVAAPEAEPLTQAEAQEQSKQNDPLLQDTLADGSTNSAGDQAQQNSLLSVDVIDLRGVSVTGRYLTVLELESGGYIFDGYSTDEATDVYFQYLGAGVEGLQLQHRNKLIKAVNMNDVPAELLISAPVISSVVASVVFTNPAPAAPAELCLGGTLYKKSSD